MVKNLPAILETWVQSLGWEDPRERREWLPSPAFWPGESQALYSLWGPKESDTAFTFLQGVIKAS